MEQDKSIAYEIAMLVKENRELKQAIKAWEDRYNELDFEYERLRERITKDKARKNKETVLTDAAVFVSKGDYVVISEVLSKKPKYDKGFVVLVDHVCDGMNGLKTLYGTCLERDDVRGVEAHEVPVKINNRSYGWNRIENGTMSTLVKVIGESRENPSSWGYINDKKVNWHYESENLITI